MRTTEIFYFINYFRNKTSSHLEFFNMNKSRVLSNNDEEEMMNEKNLNVLVFLDTRRVQNETYVFSVLKIVINKFDTFDSFY